MQDQQYKTNQCRMGRERPGRNKTYRSLPNLQLQFRVQIQAQHPQAFQGPAVAWTFQQRLQ